MVSRVGQADITAPAVQVRTWRKPTTFYPLYDGANDQVDRVTPVRRAFYQAVLPRYQLSTSETRDLGTGPGLEEISYNVYAPRHAEPQRTNGSPPGKLQPETGRIIDIFA